MPSTSGNTFSLLGRAVALLGLVALAAAPAANAGDSSYARSIAERAAHRSAVPYVPGHVLVGYESGVSREAMARTQSRVGLRLIRGFGAFDMQLLRVPSSMGVAEAVRRLNLRPGVAWAEPDYLRYPLVNPPTDVLFGDQWDLNKSTGRGRPRSSPGRRTIRTRTTPDNTYGGDRRGRRRSAVRTSASTS